MTRKLYDLDAYIREFDARVLSSEEKDGQFFVTLDQTAFFPTAGGQSADHGTLSGVRVLDVNEKDGEIIHTTESPLSTGAAVHGKIDFDERFSKMQLHTAEHILSGLLYEKYGFHNVGFHLGESEVTFDTSGVLTREQLDEIEIAANEIVYENRKVRAYYPGEEELSALTYRAKGEIEGDVRIVEIEGVDLCACCAPHVQYTGEIGVIKILEFEHHRGGLRMRLVAGRRAFSDYQAKYGELHEISVGLSVKPNETAATVAALSSRLAKTEYALLQTKKQLMRECAKSFSPTEKNPVVHLPDADYEQLRAFANEAVEKASGVLVMLFGKNGAFGYVIISKTVDLKALIPECNRALLGRGGGSSSMAQGTFGASLEEIKRYFSGI